MSATWGGNVGLNSEATFVPSGCTSARYSPSLLSLKFVCNGAPGVLRFLFEAKTTMYPFGGMLVAGNCHSLMLLVVSVRNQPARLAVTVPSLWSSIQSELLPSSSLSVVLLAAMNSLITNWAGLVPVNARHNRSASHATLFGGASVLASLRPIHPGYCTFIIVGPV